METTGPSSGAGIPVVRIITRLNIGGPAIQAASLSSALPARGYSATLLHGRLGRGEGDMSYLVSPGTRAIYIPSLGRSIQPLADIRALVAIYSALRRIRPRIVHTHLAKAGLLGRAAGVLYNATRGRAPRARLVHTYHGHVLEGYFGRVATLMFIALERLMARFTDAIVAIAPAIRRELLDDHRIGRAGQYHVIPLGFDLAPFAAVNDATRAQARQALGIAPGTPVITTVGRLTPIKQQSWLLEVARSIADRHPNLVLQIVGDGELRDALESRARQLGLGSNVRFLGWRRDLPAIYAATDVFVLTSRNEGTPVALIEAMASGIPGVSTDVGGVNTVIADGFMGILVPLDDHAAFAGGVLRLLDHPGEAATMGARGRDHVMARFGSGRLLDDIDRLYRDLLAR